MTNKEAIEDIKNNILPVVGGKSLVMAIKALETIDRIKFNVYALNELLQEAEND